MKKILSLIFWASFSSSVFAQENLPKVYVNQFVEHPALNKTVQGIKDGLEQAGYTAGENLDFRVESAQASSPLAAQISVKFVSQKADIIVAVATVSAQSAGRFARKGHTKLIFSSVTDPVGAGLVQQLNLPANNTSGVSNFIPLEPQIAFFQKIQPNLKKIGFLYNPTEANSVLLASKLKEVCAKMALTLVLQTVTKTSEVSQNATHLCTKVDAIFISNDNTALSALPTIISAANKVKIPVYVSDTDAVELGAIAALGPNQYDLGLQTAQMIVDTLRGKKDLNKTPVQFPEKTEIYLNERAAQKIGLSFPQELKDQATQIIDQEKISQDRAV